LYDDEEQQDSDEQESDSALGHINFSNKFVKENICNYYNVGKVIGSGKYGEVRLCSRKSFERKRFALKSIPRSKMNADEK